MNSLRSRVSVGLFLIVPAVVDFAGRRLSWRGKKYSLLASVLMLVWAVYAVILDVYIEMTLTSAEKQRLVYFDPMGMKFWIVVLFGLVGLSQLYIFNDTEYKVGMTKCRCVAARLYSLVAGGVVLFNFYIAADMERAMRDMDGDLQSGVRKASLGALFLLFIALGGYVISTIHALVLVLLSLAFSLLGLGTRRLLNLKLLTSRHPGFQKLGCAS